MKKLGRPKKRPDERKSRPISFRITEDLRDRLEVSRTQGEQVRTLSQEIEFRLGQSFTEAERIDDLFGGWVVATMFRAAADRIRAIEAETGKHWYEDRFTFDNCARFLSLWFARFTPEGESIEPEFDVPSRWAPDEATGSAKSVFTGSRPAPVETHVAIAVESFQNNFKSVMSREIPARRRITANRRVPKHSKKPGTRTKSRKGRSK